MPFTDEIFKHELMGRENMIIIKNKDIANQFTRTFFIMDEFIIFEDICQINENKFLIYEDDMSKKVEIDLETSNIKIHSMNHEEFKNTKIYDVKDGEMAWSMCNIVNEAVMQWKDCTPFRSKRVCKKLSSEVTRALRLYEISLELTLYSLKVFRDGIPISYEQAVHDML